MKAHNVIPLMLLGLAACSNPSEPSSPIAPSFTTYPTGTIHKYYTVGGKQVGIHILPVGKFAPMNCAPPPGGAIVIASGACGGSGGGGGSGYYTYTLAVSCSSPAASLECALHALGLTLTAPIIGGTCLAAATGLAAVACGSMIVGWGSQAQSYIQTPDCRTCPPPPAYPTIAPLQPWNRN